MAGAHLPPTRASLGTAPQGVAVTGNLLFSVQARTLVGARLPSSRMSRNDSAWCGGGRHPPPPSI
jgi:hypothetical protein